MRDKNTGETTRLERMLVTGNPEGDLPWEVEEEIELYSSNSTDLRVFDYLDKRCVTALTFYFDDHENAVRVGRQAIKDSDSFGKMVEALEENNNPRDIIAELGTEGPYNRISNQLKRLDYEVEEYTKDFRNVYEILLDKGITRELKIS